MMRSVALKMQESSKIHLATKINIYILTLQAWSACFPHKAVERALNNITF